MDLMVKYYIFLVLQACIIASVLQESSGQAISPSASFSAIPPIIEGSHDRVTQDTQIANNSLGPTSQPTTLETDSISTFESPLAPQANNGLKPTLAPNTPLNEPPPPKDPGLLPHAAAPIPSIPEGSPPSPPANPPTVPVSVPPIPQQDNGPIQHLLPIRQLLQIAPPPKEAVQNPPPVAPVAPSMPQVPPSVPQVPSSMPEGPPFIVPEPVASPPTKLPMASPPTSPALPVSPPNLPLPAEIPPSTLPSSPLAPSTMDVPPSNLSAPLASPPRTLPRNPPPSPPTLTVPPPNLPAPLASPPRTLPRNPPPSQPTLTVPPPNLPVAPRNSPKNLQPIHGNSSAPPPNIRAPIPSKNNGGSRSPVSSPPNRTTNIAPTHHSPEKAPIAHKAPSSYNHAPPPNFSFKPPPAKSHPSPSLPPMYPPPPPGPTRKPRHHDPPPPPGPEGNPRHHTPPPPFSVSPSISPSIQTTMPVLSPKVSPSHASPRIPKPLQALPPPPPNEDCLSKTCMEPLTNTPPGTPCNCVLPMQLELVLGISVYTFFPLVSELAFEIASGVFMRSSQVRIMGANEDPQDPVKTDVMIDLVPLGEKFDNVTALVTAQRLWLKQVPIKSSLFGDYEVLFVKYPGLPPSPPSRSSSNNGEPYGHGNNGRDVKPLGVDVSKQRRSNKLNGGIVAIITLSVFVAVVLVGVTVWVLLFKRPVRARSGPTPPATIPPVTKSSGVGGSITGSGPESASLSFRSSIAYTGSAKTFSLSDMEKATDNFNELGVLGEGGFGRVYSGVLEDGTKVAVKVLKRDDQQGGREFLAEVEMLSRLHHRNLVRLLGICTEEKNRCLVYELIPNGSVESHLHGVDKETAPLDWGARLKIALGAARGLAYVAPEYAMTGHLLVKSDVYSYGVVLLELLSGRKPVDMSMPSGQENLVAWARPLLPTPEGLNMLIDPTLCPEVPFDSIAKVSAIASMCVQPEVSHRPFMGEVVQALKLVCNECEEPGIWARGVVARRI
ncbi:hypothetical protein OSB04_031287 [Centaurea solstitialis]|uniref:Protein kinase domain-containing protein n=1 Tax=Centaurea solstitialis TaxID=347529 RepID=A0AA38SAG1_9ASTR|nr:hypothetical protein OSB04_031287 [Centaurea solstitialis]